jgi:hypothetical protein
MIEDWNIGILGLNTEKNSLPIIPLFHYSIVPVLLGSHQQEEEGPCKENDRKPDGLFDQPGFHIISLAGC